MRPTSRVNGVWRYVYRAVDQYGQVIDVLVSARRDADAARRFFRRTLSTLKVTPREVVTDDAAVYPGVLDELIPSAWHHVEQYANNPIEADHSRLKHRLRPMRGLRTDQTAQTSHVHCLSSGDLCGLFRLLGTGGPGGGFVVGGVGLEAAVEDAHEAVAELAQRGAMSDASGAELVVVGAGTG
jgi:IS1 family transposase